MNQEIAKALLGQLIYDRGIQIIVFLLPKQKLKRIVN